MFFLTGAVTSLPYDHELLMNWEIKRNRNSILKIVIQRDASLSCIDDSTVVFKTLSHKFKLIHYLFTQNTM